MDGGALFAILVRFVIFVIVILACVLIVPRIIGMILPLFSCCRSLNPLIKRISAKLKLPRNIAVILLILVLPLS